MEITRRQSLLALGALAVPSLLGAETRAEPEAGAHTAAGASTGVRPGTHQPAPLPFDPKRLAGLSERLLVSHHDNNYVGAVKNLNAVELELARTTPETPGFLLAGLRERQLTFTNSVILHERYFGNLGTDGSPTQATKDAIASAFGGFDGFEEQFRATALSLAGGSGWAILDFDFSTRSLRIFSGGDHTRSIAFGAPLLVLDMYEHSYHMDYGTAAARYVDAFFANVRWSAVERRLANAQKAAASLVETS